MENENHVSIQIKETKKIWPQKQTRGMHEGEMVSKLQLRPQTDESN